VKGHLSNAPSTSVLRRLYISLHLIFIPFEKWSSVVGGAEIGWQRANASTEGDRSNQ
jgi:hypothetical protein